jgi:hypothetical protein
MGRDNTLYSVGHGRVVFHGRKVHIDPTEDGVPRPTWLPGAVGA